MKLILALMLCSTVAYAAPEPLCKDRAQFIYMVGASRDKGWTIENVKQNVSQVAHEHPELGIDEGQLALMLATIDVVYKHADKAPDVIADDFFNHCITGVEAER